ncbi:MAG: PTPA-CTERM sorting domain-containing protein [Cyanobacteria bacterium P01_H01_bin.21]
MKGTLLKFGIALSGAALSLSTVELETAYALSITTPDSLIDVEGDSDNRFPLFVPSQRYQQVYNASEFSALSGSTEITQILFRPDSTFAAPFDFTIPDIQINLSTTSNSADGLSTTFADNIGTDDTVVVNRGSLALSSANTGPAGGPKDFDIVISLANPFFYNPSLGNLLLDVRTFSSSNINFFADASFIEGDSVSRVFSSDDDDVNSTTGDEDTLGLVTQFTFADDAAPIPTPALLPGFIGMGIAAFNKKRKGTASTEEA